MCTSTWLTIYTFKKYNELWVIRIKCLCSVYVYDLLVKNYEILKLYNDNESIKKSITYKTNNNYQ